MVKQLERENAVIATMKREREERDKHMDTLSKKLDDTSNELTAVKGDFPSYSLY
jgi:hypothetical protein